MIQKIRDNWDSILGAVAKYGVATVLVMLAYFQILLPYSETNRRFLENSIEALVEIRKDVRDGRQDTEDFCAKATEAHSYQADAHARQDESHRAQIEGLMRALGKQS